MVETKITTLAREQTMSSLQIAELTGKKHTHVMRDIRALLAQGVQESNFGLSYIIRPLPNGGSKNEPCYQLTKTGCLILASGYNPVLREKIINRWIELEAAAQPEVPGSFREALLLAAAQQEQLEQQQKQLAQQSATIGRQAEKIEADAPKVLFADSLLGSDHSILIGELAKILRQNGVQTGQNRLFDYMREHDYLIKTGAQRNLPTQRALEMGLFDMTTRTISAPDGSIITKSTTKVTPKGQQYFINKLAGQISLSI